MSNNSLSKSNLLIIKSNSIKSVCLLDKKISNDYLIIGNAARIKKFPFGENGAFLLLNTFQIQGLKPLQLVFDIKNSQCFYKTTFESSKTNWIFLPIDEFDDLFHQFARQMNNFSLEECLNKRNNKQHVLIKNVITSFIDELRAKEKENNFIQNAITRDCKNYLEYGDKCIVSFVDDDSSNLIPLIWGDICSKKNIKIGFACITGFINNTLKPSSSAYEQISISELKGYYDKGFDVYSHSNSHDYFYNVKNRSSNIDKECQISKAFLLSQKFYRSSHILVYPGGLGYQRISKKRPIRKHFNYGVDTVGGGLNLDPLDSYCIRRINLDCSSYDEIVNSLAKAFREKALFAFMSHSYELNKDKEKQIEKICRIIDYIESNGAKILPLSEALKIKGFVEGSLLIKKPFSFKQFLKEVHSDMKNALTKNI